MGKQDFEKFLQGQATPVGPAFNSEALLTFWREQLSVLYRDIQSWLSEYGDKISLQFEEIELNEKPLGVYSVQSATILVGTKQAQLKPIGTNLIGTPGRVDLAGPAGTIKFILADKAAAGPRIIIEELASEAERKEKQRRREEQESKALNWVWKAATPAPRIKYTTLTQDVFLDCLMGVLDA